MADAGMAIDPFAILIVVIVMGILGSVAITFLTLYLFSRELAFLPRKKYRIDLYNKINNPDTQEEKDVFTKSIKGWVVSRKGVKWLRIGFDSFISGVELDVGFMRHVEKIPDPDNKNKTIELIKLREKIPGVRDAANFEPLDMPFEVEANLERNVRQTTVTLSEITQQLASKDMAKTSVDELNKYKDAILKLTNSLNESMDKVLDHDRRLQTSQVSGWGEFTSTGIEKSTYRVKRESVLEKFLPHIMVFVGFITLILVALIASDMFSKTVQGAAGPVASACNNANAHFEAAARSCGWTPQASLNLSSVPTGVPLPS